MRAIEKILIPVSIVALLLIIPFPELETAWQFLNRSLVLSGAAGDFLTYRIVAISAILALLTIFSFSVKYLGSHRLFFAVFGLVLMSSPFFYNNPLSPLRIQVALVLALLCLEGIHTLLVKYKPARVAFLFPLFPSLAIIAVMPFYFLEYAGYAVFVGAFLFFSNTRRVSVTDLNLKAIRPKSLRRAAKKPKQKSKKPSVAKTQTAGPTTEHKSSRPPTPSTVGARAGPSGATALSSPAAAAASSAPVISQSGAASPAPTPPPPAVQAPPVRQVERPSILSRSKRKTRPFRDTGFSDELLPANVPWPGQSDYAKAMQNLEFSIAASYPRMRNAKVAPNPYVKLPGNIVYSSGNYGTIFKLENNGSSQALKCFTRSKPDLNRRYAAISRTLKSHSREGLAFVDFQYLPKAIRTFRNPEIYFPVLTMHWIEGTNLNVFIAEQLRRKDALYDVAVNFLQEMIKIRNAGIAHGDIAGDNIVINSSGRLTLVDYDGMYVPEFSGLKAEEFGHDNFQHPQRGAATYSERLDNFSILVTYLSLLAVAEDPSLWPKYNKGDQDCLIFRKSDFTDPKHSPVMVELSSRRGRIGRLTGLLTDAIHHDPLWGGCDPQNIAKL